MSYMYMYVRVNNNYKFPFSKFSLIRSIIFRIGDRQWGKKLHKNGQKFFFRDAYKLFLQMFPFEKRNLCARFDVIWRMTIFRKIAKENNGCLTPSRLGKVNLGFIIYIPYTYLMYLPSNDEFSERRYLRFTNENIVQ